MDRHPCPGWCNAAWRRAEKERARTGEEHELSVVEVTTALCDGCWGGFEHDLADLWWLYKATWAGYQLASKPALDERVSGSPRRDLNVYLDLLDVCWRMVSRWDRLYRAERGWKEHPHRAQIAAVRRQVRSLWAGRGWIREKAPWAEEFALDVNKLARSMRRATKSDVMVVRLKVPCSACGVKALRRREPYRLPEDPPNEPYHDNIRCDNCGAIWDESQYARAALVLAEQQRQQR